MWSVVEVNTLVICGCVPSLKPLVTRIIPRMIRDADETSEKTSDTQTRPLEISPTVSPRGILPPANVQLERSQFSHSEITSRTLSGSSASAASPRDPENPVDMVEFLTSPRWPSGK
jgi:hypothetical protein